MKAKIHYIDGTVEIVHSLSEVHYNFKSVIAKKLTAFESNKLATGFTRDTNIIKEFEILENDAESFGS